MPIFECKCCQYITGVNSNWHKHCRTKKHLDNLNTFVGSKLNCPNCNQHFYTLDLLNTHLIKCNKNTNNNVNIINNLHKEMSQLNKLIENQRNQFNILINEKDNQIKYLEQLLDTNNIYFRSRLSDYISSQDLYNTINDSLLQIPNIEKEIKNTLENKAQIIDKSDICNKKELENKSQIIDISKSNTSNKIEVDNKTKINDISKIPNISNNPQNIEIKSEKKNKKFSKLEKRRQKQIIRQIHHKQQINNIYLGH